MDRLERLVNLVAAMIDAEQPLSREQLGQRVGGYSPEPSAFRRNFERDKELLRRMGIPVESVPLGGEQADEQIGYTIRRDRYEIPDLGLEEDELSALRLAASAIRVTGDRTGASGGRVRDTTLNPGADGDPSASALRKLAGAITGPSQSGGKGGALADEPVSDKPLAELPGDESLPTLFEAIAERRRVRFSYGGTSRRLEPWRLAYRNGWWYLSGFDQTRDDSRTFRLDRMDSPVKAVGEPGAFDRPPGQSEQPPPMWILGEGPRTVAELAVDGPMAETVAQAAGRYLVGREDEGDRVILRVPVSRPPAFISFVLGYLDHVEIRGPTELRERMTRWLTDLASREPPSGPPPSEERSEGEPPTRPAGASGDEAARSRG